MKVTVTPGPCKLITQVLATQNDEGEAHIELITDCGFYRKLNEELKEMSFDAYGEIFNGFGEGRINELCKKYTKHITCPVPSAILKAIEAEFNLALPTAVTMEFEK